jgi:hypothetical protein
VKPQVNEQDKSQGLKARDKPGFNFLPNRDGESLCAQKDKIFHIFPDKAAMAAKAGGQDFRIVHNANCRMSCVL